jgi:hypothetical protein
MNRGSCRDPVSTASADCLADLDKECRLSEPGKRVNSTADIQVDNCQIARPILWHPGMAIEDYVKRFGRNAWDVGLSDNRLIRELTIDTGFSKVQPGEEDLRVKVLFQRHCMRSGYAPTKATCHFSGSDS